MFTQAFTVQYSPLSFLEVKSKGIVTAIKKQDNQTQKKLFAMGIYKGIPVTLEQKFPSFVIKVEQRRIAIDKSTASSIRVRVITG